MELALLVSALIVVVATYFLMSKKKCAKTYPGNYEGKERDAIVKLKVPQQFSKQKHYLFKKVVREIKIFNKLNFVMPCVGSTPILYSTMLGRLYINPKYKIPDLSGFTRLIYAYAAMTLYLRETDPIKARQLIKGAAVAFLTQNKVKRRMSIGKLLKRPLYTVPQPLYKVMKGAECSVVSTKLCSPPFEVLIDGVPWRMSPRFSYSYCVWGEGVKHYVSKDLPVQCFEAKRGMNFIYKTGFDKMKCSLSQTSDTFHFSHEGEFFALYVVSEKKEFGSSLPRRSPTLDIHLGVAEGAKIFLVKGNSKQEVTKTIGKIRIDGNSVDYILTKEEIETRRLCDEILSCCYMSRLMRLENLRKKYLAASKLVPTLTLPSIVHAVEAQSDLFPIIDSFPTLHMLAECGVSMNIIIIYNSANRVTYENISAFTNSDEVRALIERGVFVFFIDKVRAKSLAINYLCTMQEAAQGRSLIANNMPFAQHQDCSVSVQSSSGIMSIFATNTSKQSVRTSVFVPLVLGKACEKSIFMHPVIVSRNGTRCSVLSQKSGHSVTLKLPAGAKIYTMRGEQIEKAEYQTERILVRLDVQLKAGQEKIYEIIRLQKGSVGDKIFSLNQTQEELYERRA